MLRQGQYAPRLGGIQKSYFVGDIAPPMCPSLQTSAFLISGVYRIVRKVSQKALYNTIYHLRYSVHRLRPSPRKSNPLCQWNGGTSDLEQTDESSEITVP